MPRDSPHVLHLPHASRVIPPDLRSSLLLSDDELERELDRMTDHSTDELFLADASTGHVVRHEVSRLVLDPERFLDDAREPAAEYGMGVIYTRTSSGSRLREEPTPAERAALIERFYVPHHEHLTAAVDQALASHDYCLILDAHSFPAAPLPHEQASDEPRPMICLGTDAFHTPDWLAELASDAFLTSRFSPVSMNQPYSGSIVPTKHYLEEERVFSLMVEVHRDIYWDEERGCPGPDFRRVQLALRRALTLVRGRVALRFMP